jgi:hypothetical protein
MQARNAGTNGKDADEAGLGRAEPGKGLSKGRKIRIILIEESWRR